MSTQGDGMAEVTETEWEKAANLADQIADMGPAMTYRTLAAALAEEREEARAPFLRLAEVLEQPLLSERESGRIGERTQAFQDAAAIIQITAEETE